MMLLVLQATYEHVQMGIFRDEVCLASVTGDAKQTSKDFMGMLDALLLSASITMNQVDAIIANRGPAPFTVIRVLLTFVNGIAYALNIPLVGIDGLQVLLDLCKVKNPQAKAHAVVLRAFHQELYYGLCRDNATTFGCLSVSAIQQMITEIAEHDALAVAGAGLHQLGVVAAKEDAIIYDYALQYPTLIDCIHAARIALAQKTYDSLVTPLHLKDIAYSL